MVAEQLQVFFRDREVVGRVDYYQNNELVGSEPLVSCMTVQAPSILDSLAMFFSGGLIPTFVIISELGLFNTIWALVLPSAMNCWNMILFVNFFRQVPKEMLEASSLEGAGHFTQLFRIVLPTSMPVVATVALLCVVGHWNAWFDGYLYMNTDKWPLQTYIYHMMEEMKNFQLNKDKMTAAELEMLAGQNDMTLRAAQIFIAMIPVLCVYPIAQKYFVKGILLGSVKE